MHNIWFHFQKARMTFTRRNTYSEFGENFREAAAEQYKKLVLSQKILHL